MSRSRSSGTATARRVSTNSTFGSRFASRSIHPLISCMRRFCSGRRRIVRDDRSGEHRDARVPGELVHQLQISRDRIGRTALIDIVHAGDDDHDTRRSGNDISSEAAGDLVAPLAVDAAVHYVPIGMCQHQPIRVLALYVAAARRRSLERAAPARSPGGCGVAERDDPHGLAT